MHLRCAPDATVSGVFFRARPRFEPEWSEKAGVDGFNLSRTVVPECFNDVIDLLVPELQTRGAYKSAYREGTLRERLSGRAPAGVARGGTISRYRGARVNRV
jgi:hypothetical protein